MKLKLEDGFREIEIVARRDLVEFHSEELAAAFFRRLLREPGNRTAMRRFLDQEGAGDLFRRSDEEVVRWLARKVVFGDLRLLSHTRPDQLAPSATSEAAADATPRQVEQAAKAEQSASPAQSSSPAATSTEEETDPLLADTDQAAQAAVLQSAAESGAPLCEH